MPDITESYLQKINEQKHARHRLRQTITTLSLVVVLSVSWGLKLTGITLAGDAFCGHAEHVHGEACYEKALVCTHPEQQPHTHEESCIARHLICTMPEQEPHAHGESCWQREFICGQEAMQPHTHTEACLQDTLVCEQPECGGHHHEAGCYEQIPDCGLDETEGHSHDDSCLTEVLKCDQEESEGYSHDDGCFSPVLSCGLEESEDHAHDDSCYAEELTCGQEEQEPHLHEESCYTLELGCGLEEQEPHFHEEGCMVTAQVCGMEACELHEHDESCFAMELCCGQEESEDHFHSDACLQEVLQCTLTVCIGHFHTQDCFEAQIACGLEETEGHAHTEACETRKTVCGLEETEGHSHENVCWENGVGFGCGHTEADGHVHAAACLTEETELACGLTIEGHSHADECYENRLICQMEEHIHTESCYSDITADLETSDDWEMSLAGMTRSVYTEENVVQVAQSQLGCAESTLNFEVDENGVRRGITRYGQWYGNPYGDWSAMFASFCLYYAGLEDMPANAGPESMRLEWQAEGLYCSASEYVPLKGNLVFLRLPKVTGEEAPAQTESETVLDAELETDGAAVMLLNEQDTETTLPEENEEAAEEIIEQIAEETPPVSDTVNAVAIITDVSEGKLHVIQGDYHDTVAQVSYDLTDEAIVGYGMIREPMTYAALADAPVGAKLLGNAVEYDESLFADETSVFVVYTESGGNYYAFDGNGNAVQVYIESDGTIKADIDEPDLLLWSFSGSNASYLIKNLETGRYMHAYPNNGSGVTTSGAYNSVLIESGSGVKIRSNSEYARLDTGSGKFVMTREQAQAAVYQFGYQSRCTVWLDGTDGGLMSLHGSPNEGRTALKGERFVLPDTWPSPEKYSYTLKGWYDVINHCFYPPGGTVENIGGNMVFYAYWEASSYDVGVYNALVAETVSTNAFVRNDVFDFNFLFNVLSSQAAVSANSGGHSENWSLIQSGTTPYQEMETLNFIFRDWDNGAKYLSYPNNGNDQNTSGGLYSGLYTAELGDVLFDTDNAFNTDTGQGIIGKKYLGTGDHLFQYMSDPNSEYYGYYYYDSALNAASYNQSDQRFYIYEYLERTSDSAKDGGGSEKYSDFLPFNSPYANTNGKTVDTYFYEGVNGEYVGTTHYAYDAKYANDAYNNTQRVAAQYGFGMRTEVDFYLPGVPGDGDNKDMYGKDMHFKFSGDDDVWVLVDGALVLDLGGIHGKQSGEINFSTGDVSINGTKDETLSNVLANIPAGDHTLTIYYLERGSSQSNCAIFFNLAPRYSFQIQKEDVLTREVLNGAQFSVYMDKACTVPAKLWTSEASHDAGDPSTNEFTVVNGIVDMWGMCAGNTYYIKETKPPDAEGYGFPNGIIELRFDMQGFITYQVYVIEDVNGLSPGFTVHGIKVDEKSQSAYIVATNMPDVEEQEPIQIAVKKRWDDDLDHSDDDVTVYLTVTDPDGTVRRIREIVLSEKVNWVYVWENLPKYDADGNEVVYGVQEALVPGYVSRVEVVETWDAGGEGSGIGTYVPADAFIDGETYLLSTKYGYLAGETDGLELYDSPDKAADANDIQWMASINTDGTVTLKNLSGRTLYYSNYAFRASASPGGYQALRFENGQLYCHIDHGFWSENQYPIDNDSVKGNAASNHVLYSTNYSPSALTITPELLTINEPDPVPPVEGTGLYQVTNTPLTSETSLSVQKKWVIPQGYDESLYEQSQVTVRLLANGVDTGRTVILSLKNGWQDTFRGLPCWDSTGNLIQYSVEEVRMGKDWWISYDLIHSSGGTVPTYSTVITNTYQPSGPMLPSTGTAARQCWQICGWSIILGCLMYAIGDRHRRERRTK